MSKCTNQLKSIAPLWIFSSLRQSIKKKSCKKKELDENLSDYLEDQPKLKPKVLNKMTLTKWMSSF